MFKMGDKVYPKKIDEYACNATYKEMRKLAGLICEVDKYANTRKYSINWINTEDGEEAEFDHGLKNAWWTDNQLFSADKYYDYERIIENIYRPDEEDIDYIID